MDNSVEVRIKNIMSSVFQVPLETISDDSSQDTIELWDSLNHMNLIVSLEEEFEIELDDDAIIEMLNFKLIQSVVTHAKTQNRIFETH